MPIRRSQIQAFSASLLAAAASATAVYIEPYIASATPAQRALYGLAGVPILYACFRISEFALRWFYFRKILGKWYYVTISNENVAYRDENYAEMKFFFDQNGSLHYRVQHFDNPKDLQSKRNSTGKATSEALDYVVSTGEVHVLYNVNLHKDNMPRRGRLLLTLDSAQGFLYGEWASVVSTGTLDEVSRGRMFATRPKCFETESTNWLTAQQNESTA